jgi:hypothetical protein
MGKLLITTRKQARRNVRSPVALSVRKSTHLQGKQARKVPSMYTLLHLNANKTRKIQGKNGQAQRRRNGRFLGHSLSEDSLSVNNVEKLILRSLAKPITCKIVKKTLVAKINVAKDNKKKASKSTEKEDALLEAVNNMQIQEDDIEMIESDDDDVLSLNSNEMDIGSVPLEQDSRINVSKFNGNEPTQEIIECLASTAELLCPNKRTKVEELSTITIAYMKNKQPDQQDQKQKLRGLFDSGCGAILINKKFVRHWKKQKANPPSAVYQGWQFQNQEKM